MAAISRRLIAVGALVALTAGCGDPEASPGASTSTTTVASTESPADRAAAALRRLTEDEWTATYSWGGATGTIAHVGDLFEFTNDAPNNPTKEIWDGTTFYADHPQLEALPYAQRRQRVMAAINNLGVTAEREVPSAPDPAFAARVTAFMQKGLTEPCAVMMAGFEALLASGFDITPEARTIITAAETGELQIRQDRHGEWMAGLVRWMFGARAVRLIG